MAKKQTQNEIKVEKNITQRCGGYSFRVRMMAHNIRIDETFDTLIEARAFRDMKRASLALDPTAQHVLQSRAKRGTAAKETVALLLDKYESEITSAKKGQRAEKYCIKKLRRFSIAMLPIQHVDRAELLRFIRDCEKDGMSSTTIRKYLMLISGLFTTAIKRWGHKIGNPVQEIEIPAANTGRNRRLLAGEYDRIHEELQRCRNRYAAPLFVLAVETAARRGELLKLEWEHVSLENSTAMLWDTKNGSNREIPLSSKAKEVLNDLAEMAGLQSSKEKVVSINTKRFKGKVFPIPEHKARSAFEWALRRARSRYEEECVESAMVPQPDYLTNLRFHDLRHEATTRLFERGFDTMEASSVTGHKTLSMLKRYTHLRAEDLARKLG